MKDKSVLYLIHQRRELGRNLKN